MYKPSEIDNFSLLSSYLRTSNDLLNSFINGKRFLIDLKSDSKFILTSGEGAKLVIIERFHIPKKNKKLGYRVVYKLRKQFSVDILKVLKFNLNDLYEPQDCVHGFVKNRNILTNAKCHLNKKYLVKLDIKNFFESIRIDSVKSAFISLGFIEEIANYLSIICTLDGRLVQGYSTSPIIANIVCEELDKKIITLCNELNITYTRYADDISLSSDTSYPEIKQIQSILKEYNFELNDLKSKKFKFGQNQYVTGLSIADDKYPRIPKPIKRKLRQQLHYLNLYGYHSHICQINNWDENTHASLTYRSSNELRNRIKGWIDYINSIEPDLAKKFYQIFEQIETQKQKYNFENETIIIVNLEIRFPILKK